MSKIWKTFPKIIFWFQGLKGTLQMMDHEMPRGDNAISNRQLLMRELHIEKLMKRNKVWPCAGRSVICKTIIFLFLIGWNCIMWHLSLNCQFLASCSVDITFCVFGRYNWTLVHITTHWPSMKSIIVFYVL